MPFRNRFGLKNDLKLYKIDWIELEREDVWLLWLDGRAVWLLEWEKKTTQIIESWWMVTRQRSSNSACIKILYIIRQPFNCPTAPRRRCKTTLSASYLSAPSHCFIRQKWPLLDLTNHFEISLFTVIMLVIINTSLQSRLEPAIAHSFRLMACQMR